MVTYTPGVDEVDEVDVDVDLDDPLQIGSVSCADNLLIYRANFATLRRLVALWKIYISNSNFNLNTD